MTPEQLIKNLERSKEQIKQIAKDAEFIGAQKAKDLVLGRLYGFGGAEDVNGNKLPVYKTQYYVKKARKTSSTWDLQLKGDLKLSLTVGTYNNSPAFGISTKKQVLKSEGLENRSKRIIFAISNNERKVIVETMQEFVKDEFSKMVQTW